MDFNCMTFLIIDLYKIICPNLWVFTETYDHVLAWDSFDATSLLLFRTLRY